MNLNQNMNLRGLPTLHESQSDFIFIFLMHPINNQYFTIIKESGNIKRNKWKQSVKKSALNLACLLKQTTGKSNGIAANIGKNRCTQA